MRSLIQVIADYFFVKLAKPEISFLLYVLQVAVFASI